MLEPGVVVIRSLPWCVLFVSCPSAVSCLTQSQLLLPERPPVCSPMHALSAVSPNSPRRSPQLVKAGRVANLLFICYRHQWDQTARGLRNRSHTQPRGKICSPGERDTRFTVCNIFLTDHSAKTGRQSPKGGDEGP